MEIHQKLLIKLFRNFVPRKSVQNFFYISNTLISNARLKLAKNQANVKQHPEAELLFSENYLHSLSMLPSKNNSKYSKNKQKKNYVCKNEDENEK